MEGEAHENKDDACSVYFPIQVVVFLIVLLSVLGPGRSKVVMLGRHRCRRSRSYLVNANE